MLKCKCVRLEIDPYSCMSDLFNSSNSSNSTNISCQTTMTSNTLVASVAVLTEERGNAHLFLLKYFSKKEIK